MLILLALLCCCCIVCSHKHVAPKDDESLIKCKYSRADAIKCAKKYGDTNNDNAICFREIEQLKDAVLWIWETIIMSLYPSQNIMKRCDFDQDGYITDEDFENSKDTCLHDCDALHDFFNYVCNRAAVMKLDLPPVACE